MRFKVNDFILNVIRQQIFKTCNQEVETFKEIMFKVNFARISLYKFVLYYIFIECLKSLK